jgi:small subunit ribosomal protein S15
MLGGVPPTGLLSQWGGGLTHSGVLSAREWGDVGGCPPNGSPTGPQRGGGLAHSGVLSAQEWGDVGGCPPQLVPNWPATFTGRMTLTQERKRELIAQFGDGPTDTGRTEVQVAMLTERINELTDHLRTHRQDHSSRRGLLMLVGRRRRFLNYLQREDLERYRSVIRELGLRR